MNAYDQYSATYLSELYFVIKRNIENGFLSRAMYQELQLIRQAMTKKGIVILADRHKHELHRKIN
ncbi:hypothetical protein M3N64_08960 [Sporolactobacillus sp. CPB3-1]|uniref:Uncharacterized protein n=1 Tax=Sporolactobacillus mangiferae TaxID=2940498 RepID=A0ABT0MB39_9BACL|nr:hypothetical protein [Sporolactobacillus mangiferae]MCL1632079.1 hypothetical protein [Sporolactobacillus mangiferae]